MVTSSSTSTDAPGRARAPVWLIVPGVLVFIALFVAGVAVGGQLGEFMGSGFAVLPFTVLAVTAYLGIDRWWGKVMAWIAMLGVLLGLAFYTFGLSALALLDFNQASAEWDVGAFVKLGLILAGMGLAAIAGAIGFLPWTRRVLSRVLPIDPNSFVHMVGLTVVSTLTLVSLVPLLVLGEPVMLAIIAGPNASDFLGNSSSGEMLRQNAYALVWTVVSSVFAVGFLVWRTLRESLARLGLTRPTGRQVIGGIGLALVLAIAATGLGGALGWVWDMLGWTRTDSDVVGKLLGPYTSPIGAVVVGVTAGLGEELSVRGVLQPRLGLLLSNVFFVSLHAFQYSWDSLVVLFFVGIVLGLLRRRTNTTTSAITHGTYDFLLIMAATMLGPWSF